MEVSKYRDEILKSKEQLEEEELAYRVEQAELNVRGVISETKKTLIKKKKELAEALRSDSFDFANYSDIEEDVIALTSGLEKAQKFLKEKF